MASITRQISIAAPRRVAWSAVRDVGAIHTRLVPGLVTNTEFDGQVRTVTFQNGMVVKEAVIDIDDANCRLAYGAIGGLSSHHNSSIQIFDEGQGSQGCRLVWITDVLPNDIAPKILPLIEGGIAIMKQAIEKQAAA